MTLPWLQDCFQDCLINWRCDSEWALHLPDLNPLNFYLWSYLKGTVCKNNPQTIHGSKEKTTATIRAMPKEGQRSVLESSKILHIVFKHVCKIEGHIMEKHLLHRG